MSEQLRQNSKNGALLDATFQSRSRERTTASFISGGALGERIAILSRTRVSCAPAKAGASRAGQDRGSLADTGRRAMKDKIGQGPLNQSQTLGSVSV